MPLQGREKDESLREPESQIEELSETYEGSSHDKEQEAMKGQKGPGCLKEKEWEAS